MRFIPVLSEDCNTRIRGGLGLPVDYKLKMSKGAVFMQGLKRFSLTVVAQIDAE